MPIGQIVAPLAETFRHQPGGERIQSSLPDEEVWADPERLSQVVNNLLSNALRYALAGPIVVGARRRNGYLRVEVTDHGPGIPTGEQSRIWEKFYRGSAALMSENRGSGLGLAVVKHLVELHGGQVGLSSKPGHRTTFWFTLPLHSAEGPPEPLVAVNKEDIEHSGR